MDTPVPSPDARVKSPRARQFLRSPVLFASIQMSNLNGFIVNASEGGLCIQTVREIPDEQEVPLRFQSMRPHRWVETRARIVWKNESKTVAGLQFLNATSELLAEVGHWLSFGASLQELRGDWWPTEVGSEVAVAPPVETSAGIETNAEPPIIPKPIEVPAEAIERQAPVEKKAEPSLASPPVRLTPPSAAMPAPYAVSQRTVVAIAGTCVLLVLAYLGWYEGFGRGGDTTDPGKVATSAPSRAEAAPETTGMNVTSTRLPAASAKAVKASESAPLDVPKAASVQSPAVDSGFVLQVAAMSEADNANNLVDALQEKHLPAFVSKKDTDRFYRVLVGPYSDQSELRQAQATLGTQGYQSIEKNWSR